MSYIYLVDKYYRLIKKAIIFILLLFLMAPEVMAQQKILSEVDLKFNQLKWVVGTWERQGMQEHRQGWEKWTVASDSVYDGVGMTTEYGDTVFVESLQIVKKNSSLYYVADVPENPSPVWFEITETSDHHFRSENPNHDFPKRIHYDLEGEILRVVVAGDEKRITYRFIKK